MKCLTENKNLLSHCCRETKKGMEGRLANAWRLTVNDKNFIKTALLSEIRIDGRKPFEYRKISIKFGRQVLASFVNVCIT